MRHGLGNSKGFFALFYPMANLLDMFGMIVLPPPAKDGVLYQWEEDHSLDERGTRHDEKSGGRSEEVSTTTTATCR